MNYAHLVWAMVTIYIAHIFKRMHTSAVIQNDTLEPRIESLEKRVKVLYMQYEDFLKVAEDTKKLASQVNLSMGIKTLVRRDP